MGARAEAVAATRTRILDAATASFWGAPTMAIPLDEVAERAGVAVQTVLRHFGSRDALLAAAAARESERVARQRDAVAPGDVDDAVRVLLDHYEEMGDRALRLLAEEQRNPALTPMADLGRAGHRAWCRRVFADVLAPLRGVDRERRLAQLVAVCDVQTWKLLARDAGLSRRQTELAIRELLAPLLEVP